MTPAFPTRGSLYRFISCILFFLVLPLGTSVIGYAPRSQMYRAVPNGAGPYPAIEKQIFESGPDIDVLFIGDSLLWSAIDIPYVKDVLSNQLGRPATVMTFAGNWDGVDRYYVLLRDLLKHRRVKLAILSMPTPRHYIDKPHIQAFHWLRLGEDNEVFEGLPWSGKAAVYAEMMFGAPRQMLGRIRSDLVSEESTDESLLNGEEGLLGYRGSKFIEQTIDPPAISADSMIYSQANRSQFRFDGLPLGPLQRNFTRLLGKLIRESGIDAGIVHLPRISEVGLPTVDEREYWPNVFGADVSIIGISSRELFRGKQQDEIEKYYYDEHFNANGKKLFTRTIVPALLKLYAGSPAKTF